MRPIINEHDLNLTKQKTDRLIGERKRRIMKLNRLVSLLLCLVLSSSLAVFDLNLAEADTVGTATETSLDATSDGTSTTDTTDGTSTTDTSDGTSTNDGEPVAELNEEPIASEPQDTGSISGFLWIDGDGRLATDWNGLYDGGEAPLAGYIVYLYASDDLTTPIAQTQTGDDGTYTFAGLEPGGYVLGLAESGVGDADYLLPMSATDDCKFTTNWDADPVMAFSDTITITGGAAVQAINAGMRLEIYDTTVDDTVQTEEPDDAPAPPAPVVITNDPGFDPNTAVASPNSIIWTNIQDHPGYDNAYTSQISGSNNGKATMNHVVRDASVSFYGYGIPAYTDYIFTTAYQGRFSGISFNLVPTNMNFHTFHESAFLFNGTLSSGKYTGYALALVNSNQKNGTASLSLYYMNGVTLPAGDQQLDFTAAKGASLITTFMTRISNQSSAQIPIKLTADPVTKAFKIYVNGSQRISVAKPQSGANDGFGFMTSYFPHDCAILTIMRFVYVKLDVPTTPTSCAVNFLEDGTGAVLGAQQTENGYSGQRFTVTPPDIPGYVYSRSDRDLAKLMYAPDPNDNVVNLYYVPFCAEKHASAKGAANDGTAANPVQLAPGDIITYTIPIKSKFPSTDTTPIVFGPAGLIASGGGYTSSYSGGSGGTTALAYALTTGTFPNGVRAAPAASPVCVESILRQGNYSNSNVYEHYLWLETAGALPTGSYTVNITVSADTRTWSDNNENALISPATYVSAFMRGVVGGKNDYLKATYVKAYGYSKFTDQFFPDDNSSPLTLPAKLTATFTSGNNGRVTFRNGHTGFVTNAGSNFATTNNPYYVPTEISTFKSAITLNEDQAAVVGLCLGSKMNGNTFSSQEHLTSMIRVFKLEFIPVPPPKNPVVVTDTLPAGLQYVAGSQSVTGSKAVAVFSQSGQTLTWNLDDFPPETTTVSFQAAVKQTGVFVNSARVTLASNNATATTNSTYHATCSYPVTERYLDCNSGTSVKPDLTTSVLAGGSYDVSRSSLADVVSAGRTYTYYGYRYMSEPDGALHKGLPPMSDGSGACATFANIEAAKMIYLFFALNPRVTVEFYDADNPGTQLRTTVSDTVPYGADYALSGDYRSPIAYGGKVYNYSGYAADGGGGAVKPPSPLYHALTGDKVIKLYFRAAPAVNVHFVEYRHSVAILADDQAVFAPGVGAPFSVPDNLMDDIGVAAINKVYTYVGYTVGPPTDSADINLGAPPEPTIGSVPNSGAEITLYFHTAYAVTQVYHQDIEYSDTAVYTPLIPDVVQAFYGGNATAGLGRPDPLYAGGYQYSYAGYKWDSDGSELNLAPAVPADFTVWADTTIVYWYHRQAASDNYTIVTQYHRADTGGQLSPDITDLAVKGSGYAPPYENIITDQDGDVWRYAGYQIDGGPMVSGPAQPALDRVDAAHVITLLYERLTTTTLTISNTVDGQFGDRTEDFTFTIRFEDTGGNPPGPFSYTGASVAAGAEPPEDGILTLDNGALIFTLKHGQSITIENVPLNRGVQITQTRDDNYETSFTDSGDNGTIVFDNDTAMLPMTADRVFAFSNTRKVVPLTGISLGKGGAVMPFALALLLALAACIGKKALRHPKRGQ